MKLINIKDATGTLTPHNQNVDLDETIIAVAADHTTSSTTREHEDDLVPIVI